MRVTVPVLAFSMAAAWAMTAGSGHAQQDDGRECHLFAVTADGHSHRGALQRSQADLKAEIAAWRRKQGDAASTIVTRVAGVRTFLAVCYRENVLTFEQADRMGVRPYKTRQSQPHSSPLITRASAQLPNAPLPSKTGLPPPGFNTRSSALCLFSPRVKRVASSPAGQHRSPNEVVYPPYIRKKAEPTEFISPLVPDAA